jgi:hypothetical protein
MAVLIEANTVVVRVDAIQRSYEHGLWEFRRDVPNRTFCTDGVLARVSFMAPVDVLCFVNSLALRGLRYRRRHERRDVAIIDQERADNAACDWLDVYQIPVERGLITVAECTDASAHSACTLDASPEVIVADGRQVAVPAHWKYASSLSASGISLEPTEADERMQFLNDDDKGLCTCYDGKTGRIVYIGSQISGSMSVEEHRRAQFLETIRKRVEERRGRLKRHGRPWSRPRE